MKHTIITCDLCNGRIYRDGYFQTEEGAIAIRARELMWLDRAEDMERIVVFPKWKRRKYHICPKCVDKIKMICKGKKPDATPECYGKPNTPNGRAEYGCDDCPVKGGCMAHENA